MLAAWLFVYCVSFASFCQFHLIFSFICFLSFVITYFISCDQLQCLSPAGEYNLRLGIIKELNPDMVATYSGRYCFLYATE